MVELHSVGEQVVAAMLREMGDAGRLSDVRCRCCTEPALVPPAFADARGPLTVHAEVRLRATRLDTGAAVIIDPMHRIDVGIASDRHILPLECKLGEAAMTCGAVIRNFLAPYEIGPGGHLIGTVPALLAGCGDPALTLEAVTSGPLPLVPNAWVLVARRSVLSRWGETNLRKYHCCTVDVETLVEALAGGKKRFNEIVAGLVGHADYYGSFNLA